MADEAEEVVELPAREVVAPQAQLLELGQIAELENVRLEVEAERVESLAESIRVTGLLAPVVVRPTPRGSRHRKPYELIVGYRRLAAFRLLGEPKIPALVHEAADEEVLTEMITENLQREDFTAMDEARAMQRLIATFGWTHAEVAARLSVHRTQVTKRLGLLELPDKVVGLLEQERITPSHAEVIASMPTADAQEELAELAVRTQAPVSKLASYAAKIKSQEETTAGLEQEEVVDQDTPLVELQPEDVTPLPRLQLREDLRPLELRRLHLYAALRSFNDRELLDFLDEELLVTPEGLWDWVAGLESGEVEEVLRVLILRWAQAAHRYPTLPAELRSSLGEGEVLEGPELELPDSLQAEDPDYDPDYLDYDESED